jgi:hypothetical protein
VPVLLEQLAKRFGRGAGLAFALHSTMGAASAPQPLSARWRGAWQA